MWSGTLVSWFLLAYVLAAVERSSCVRLSLDVRSHSLTCPSSSSLVLSGKRLRAATEMRKYINNIAQIIVGLEFKMGSRFSICKNHVARSQNNGLQTCKWQVTRLHVCCHAKQVCETVSLSNVLRTRSYMHLLPSSYKSARTHRYPLCELTLSACTYACMEGWLKHQSVDVCNAIVIWPLKCCSQIRFVNSKSSWLINVSRQNNLQ